MLGWGVLFTSFVGFSWVVSLCIRIVVGWVWLHSRYWFELFYCLPAIVRWFIFDALYVLWLWLLLLVLFCFVYRLIFWVLLWFRCWGACVCLFVVCLFAMTDGLVLLFDYCLYLVDGFLNCGFVVYLLCFACWALVDLHVGSICIWFAWFTWFVFCIVCLIMFKCLPLLCCLLVLLVDYSSLLLIIWLIVFLLCFGLRCL